ncbi:hypothetical protein DIPPA_33477 [Diplonema papillatum]|nr:hypothetical protein DIPPA_33477 [Diplonema papillatum]
MPVGSLVRAVARKSVSFSPTVAFLVYDSPQHVAGVDDRSLLATDAERPVGEGVLRPLAQPAPRRAAAAAAAIRRRSSTPIPSAAAAPRSGGAAAVNSYHSGSSNSSSTTNNNNNNNNSNNNNNNSSNPGGAPPSPFNSPAGSPVFSASQLPRLFGAKIPNPAAPFDNSFASPPASPSSRQQQQQQQQPRHFDNTAAVFNAGNNVSQRVSPPKNYNSSSRAGAKDQISNGTDRQFRISRQAPPPVQTSNEASSEGPRDEKWQQALGIARELIKQNTVVTKNGAQIDVRGVAAAAQKVINSQRMRA